jgi:hypothetical protein
MVAEQEKGNIMLVKTGFINPISTSVYHWWLIGWEITKA